MKAKVGELEDDVREGFYSKTNKELIGVLEAVSSNRKLVRFQDGCEKYLTSNKLTAVTVDRIVVTK